MTSFSGAYTAIITPFNASNHVNEEGLRKNIRFQIENGIDGITALGTTGEAPTLTETEKETIICIAKEETQGKVPLMVGTSHNSTQQTIKNTQLAKELGADSVLIVVPYYNKPTQEGIYQHFFAIAKAVDIPIIIYNNPTRAGVNVSLKTVQRLGEISNIIGIKESTGNISQAMEFIESFRNKRPEFSIVSGDDDFTLPLMAIGGHGVISVVGNLIPSMVKAMVSAAQQKDFENAREIHYRFLSLFKGAFMESNPIPIKAAMNLCGMAAGGCRLPLCEMMPENHQLLKQIVNGAMKNEEELSLWLKEIPILRS